MNLIVNPGSHIPADAIGWTNSYEGALAEARRWLASMVAEGFGSDLELVEPEPCEEHDGRWTFTFEHHVTGVTAELETPGIDDLDAYKRQHVFPPRQYWRGSSSLTPALSDWEAPGFVQTFRPSAVTVADRVAQRLRGDDE